jgi:hypothetical protein
MTVRLKSNGYRLGDHLPGHRARIVDFVRDQPQGRSCAEIAALLGVNVNTASTTCWQMVTRSGTLFRGTPVGRRGTRYFATQALADAWVATVPPGETKEQRKAKRVERNKLKAEKASLAPTAHVRERPKMVGEPIITEKTRRYQVDPRSDFRGEFSRLGFARYIA